MSRESDAQRISKRIWETLARTMFFADVEESSPELEQRTGEGQGFHTPPSSPEKLKPLQQLHDEILDQLTNPEDGADVPLSRRRFLDASESLLHSFNLEEARRNSIVIPISPLQSREPQPLLQGESSASRERLPEDPLSS